MTTPALLMRQRIESTLTAAGLLGTYTLPGGETVPALSLGDPPEGTTVDGLECLIATNPKPITPEMFGIPDLPRAYPVRLVNHADAADVIQDATNALAQAFWPFWDDPVLLEATADIPEQATMSLLYDPDSFPQEE